MISKFNPRNRKLVIVIGSLVIWFLLLISPIGNLVAVLTIVGWIVVFLMLGLIKVQGPPEK